jgi:hypothetical protein
MSTLKFFLLLVLVTLAFVMTGFGGLRDLSLEWIPSREHAWNDGMFLMLVAILVAIVMK